MSATFFTSNYLSLKPSQIGSPMYSPTFYAAARKAVIVPNTMWSAVDQFINKTSLMQNAPAVIASEARGTFIGPALMQAYNRLKTSYDASRIRLANTGIPLVAPKVVSTFEYDAMTPSQQKAYRDEQIAYNKSLPPSKMPLPPAITSDTGTTLVPQLSQSEIDARGQVIAQMLQMRSQRNAGVITPTVPTTAPQYVSPRPARPGVAAFVGADVMRCVGAVQDYPPDLQPMAALIDKTREEYFKSLDAPPPPPKVKDTRAADTEALKKKLALLEDEFKARLARAAEISESLYANTAAQAKIKTLNIGTMGLNPAAANAAATSAASPVITSAPTVPPVVLPTPSPFTPPASAPAPKKSSTTLYLGAGVALLAAGYFFFKSGRK